MDTLFLFPTSRSVGRRIINLVLTVALASSFMMFVPAGGLGAPAHAQTSPELPNGFPQSCGLDVLVILDESGSIRNAGAIGEVKDAFNALVGAWQDTGSRMAVIDFNSNADDWGNDWVDITGANQSVFNNYINGYDPPGSPFYWTNWEDANRVAHYSGLAGASDLTIIITDGNPTAHIADSVVSPDYETRWPVAVPDEIVIDGSDSAGVAVAYNASLANAALVRGETYYWGIGVGDAAEDGPFGRLSSITDAATRVADFGDLDDLLRAAAFEACDNTLTITKQVGGPDDLPGDVAGWTFDTSVVVGGSGVAVSPPSDTTDNSGNAQFEWDTSGQDLMEITVTESAGPNGFNPATTFVPEAVSCEYRTLSGGSTPATVTPSGTTFVISDVPSRAIITCDVLNTIERDPAISVHKAADPTSIDEPGGTVGFDVDVDNDSSPHDPVTITSLVDDIHGDLNGRGDCSVPQTIDPGNRYSCSFSVSFLGSPGESETDTVTAMGTDDEGVPVSASDSATVTINDVPSSISLTKDASPLTVTEPGGNVQFDVRVDNDSAVDGVSITSLVDDVHGDLNGQGTCAVPQTIAAGGHYTCSFSAYVGGDPGDSEIDTVTASGTDDDGAAVTAEDSATVTIEDAPSSIEVTKSTQTPSIPEPGGTVRFDVMVENTSSADHVDITSLVDDPFGDITSVHGDITATSCAVPQTLILGASYNCWFDAAVTGNAGDVATDTVTVSGVDDDGQPVSGEDSATVTFSDELPDISVDKTVDPTWVAEPGDVVTFSVVVTNDSVSSDPVTITSLLDDIHGDLNGQGDCSVPQTIAAGADYSCSFDASVQGNPGDVEIDTVTASGTDDDGTPVSDFDTAEVTVVDTASAIVVTKTATPTIIDEPGDTVVFDVLVENVSAVDSVTISTLVDDIHGDLDGQGDCSVPQTIAAGGSYACSFAAFVAGDAGDSETDTVTASGLDDDGLPVSGEDSATVDVQDALPSIWVDKWASPTWVNEPGASVTFNVMVYNESASTDPVTITSLVDDVHGDLNGRGDCAVPQTIAAGGSYGCSFLGFVGGPPGYVEVDTVTASGADDDGNPVSAGDTAQVTVLDLASSILVTKTATPTAVAEPGADVTFDVSVRNTSSVDSVTINSLVDDIHGNLDGQGDCAVPQTLGAGATYSCSFTALVAGDAGAGETDTVTADGIDDDGNPVSGSDTATVTVTDAMPKISVDKSASPTTIDEPGGNVAFTVVVDNDSVASDPVTITSLLDDVHGDLNGQGDCAVPQTIASGASYTCSFTAFVGGDPGDVEVDTVTASGADDDGNSVTASDTAQVTVLDTPSGIEVAKTATPTSVAEPGGWVTFEASILNTSSVDAVTIASLVDDVHGDLDGRGDCSVPQTIAAGATYGCSFTAFVAGNAGYVEVDIITASGTDDDGSPVSDNDPATVTMTDVDPSISVDKSASPTTIDEPGGNVAFTVVVDNDSVASDPVTITSLLDDVHGDLNGQGDCAVPQTIASGASYTCSFTAFVAGDPGDVEVDTVTASGTDDEGNPVSAGDTASVTVLDTPSGIEVTKTASPTRVDEPGADVTFDVSILNTSSVDAVTITSLVDDVHGDLDGRGDCSVPQTIAAGATYGCSFTAFVAGDPGYVEVDIITASGTDDDGSPVSDSDGADVTIDDVESSIEVTKTATPDEVPEPGAMVTFEVVVENTSAVDTVTLLTLTDSIYGDVTDGSNPLLESSTCGVPVELDPGETYECEFEALVTGNAGDTETDVVTAGGIDDDDEGVVSDDDEAMVIVTDELPVISLLKTPSTDEVDEPGADVDFTIEVTNESVEDVTLLSLSDTVFGDLSGQGDCAVPQILEPGESYGCSFTGFVGGGPGTAHVNFATALAVDDEQNEAEASDDAVVLIGDVPSGIDVDKTALPGSVLETGGDVEFVVTVINTSATDDVLVESVVDDVFGDIGDTCELELPALLGPGDSMQCTFTEFISGPAGTIHTNVVTVSGTDDDENPVESSDEETVDFEPEIDLEVTKRSDPALLNSGETGEFIVAVTNQGPSAATGVELTDQLPAGLSYVAHNGAGTFDPVTGVWAVGGLAVGETATLTITVLADATGVYTNTVEVTAADQPDIDSEPGDGQGDDYAEATIEVVQVLASGQIGDTVWWDTDGDGVQDSTEVGIPNATLELTNLDTNEVQTMKTNEDGLYLFAALEPGRYQVVSFKPSSDTSRTTPSSFTINLAEGEAYLDADFGYSDVLPDTGMEIEMFAQVGLALLALGLVFVGFGRRRREEG